MTPLHWAAYNEDVDTVKFLMENGALLLFNKSKNSPVDIAGFCNIEPVINYFN